MLKQAFFILCMLCASGCVPVTPVPDATTTTASAPIDLWFGMHVPLEDWDTETLTSDPLRVATLTHRALANCHITITTDPWALLKPQSGAAPVAQEYSTEQVQINLAIIYDVDLIKGIVGDPLYIFYDVFSKTRREGGSRLAYFVIETDKARLVPCAEAFLDVLKTLQPEYFPQLNTPQG